MLRQLEAKNSFKKEVKKFEKQRKKTRKTLCRSLYAYTKRKMSKFTKNLEVGTNEPVNSEKAG